MTDRYVLNGSVREILGSADSRRLRHTGKIPAIIYNAETSKSGTAICVTSKELFMQYLTGKMFTTIASIEFDNKKVEALAHRIELHPITDLPIHVDFVPIQKNRKIKVQIRVRLINTEQSVGLKRGGYANILKRRINVNCDPEKIPAHIDLDVSMMQNKEKRKMKDLIIPEDCVLIEKLEETLLVIKATRGG